MPELRHPRPVHRAARVQHDAQDLPRPGGVRGGPALPAPGDGAGHLRELPQRADDRRGASPRSASARSARASATRSRRATSSSARASSSRWRWSTSSSRARTRNCTSTGSTSARAGTSTWGSRAENLRHYEHPKEKLSHYSKRTVDIEYRFGFTGQEWGELEGIANRTDFDLTTHSNHSGADLSFYDQASGTRYRPYVIEPAAGVGRSMMAFLVEAYAEDEAPNAKGGVDKRVVLRLDRRLAPVKAAVLPLSRNAELSPKARDLAAALRRHWNVDFDDAGAIGRRYRRQDEIGTPFCVTVDFDTLDRPGRDRPRARLDGAGAGGAGPGRGLPGGPAARLLTRRGRPSVAVGPTSSASSRCCPARQARVNRAAPSRAAAARGARPSPPSAARSGRPGAGGPRTPTGCAPRRPDGRPRRDDRRAAPACRPRRGCPAPSGDAGSPRSR